MNDKHADIIEKALGPELGGAVREIALLVKEAGGRAMLVGGAVRDAVYGYEPNARSIAGDFILGMFNRAEFFAGITPGYVFGTGSSRSKSDDGMAITEQRVDLVNRFAISADAGFSMSFRIWQFNLSIVPAVHYFLTKNYIYVSETTPIDGGASKITETPVRFQYSVLGALGRLNALQNSRQEYSVTVGIDFGSVAVVRVVIGSTVCAVHHEEIVSLLRQPYGLVHVHGICRPALAGTINFTV